MDTALKIIAIITMGIVNIVCIWGFILFYRHTDDVRKQNMLLFSILEKPGSARKMNHPE